MFKIEMDDKTGRYMIKSGGKNLALIEGEDIALGFVAYLTSSEKSVRNSCSQCEYFNYIEDNSIMKCHALPVSTHVNGGRLSCSLFMEQTGTPSLVEGVHKP